MIAISCRRRKDGTPSELFEVDYIPAGRRNARLCTIVESKARLLDLLIRIHGVEAERAASAIDEAQKDGSAKIE